MKVDGGGVLESVLLFIYFLNSFCLFEEDVFDDERRR